MQSTTLFRASKVRSSRSQHDMEAKLRHTKQQYTHLYDDRSIYLNSYNLSLPNSSIKLLKIAIDSLTERDATMNPNNRDLHTVGTWISGTTSMYRCCFIQPELTSTMCCVPLSAYYECVNKTNLISNSIPGCVPCTVTPNKNVAQMSGRLTPYVIDEIGIKCEWDFVNIAKSRMLFICTDDNGSHILTLSHKCIMMIKEHMPDGSVCIYDVRTSGYKITASPHSNRYMPTPNKNTCMMMYGDGAFKFLGKPSGIAAVASSFRKSLISVMSSRSSSVFISSLNSLPAPK